MAIKDVMKISTCIRDAIINIWWKFKSLRLLGFGFYQKENRFLF